LRIDAYNHLQELELAYFEERSTGGLMSILSDDINQLEDFLNQVANEIIQLTTSFIVLIGGAFLSCLQHSISGNVAHAIYSLGFIYLSKSADISLC